MAKIYLGGFSLYIKCDQRPFTDPFPAIMLSPGRPIYAIPRSLEGSNDIKAMRPAIERYAEYLRGR
jgi:hypothetical protein